MDTATAYFEAGLKSNEFCVWAISDPITWEDAVNALREVVSDFDQRLEAGQIEIIPGTEWYLPGGEFDLQQITGGWRVKLATALAKGYDGMRVSGNAFWIGTSHWKEFCEYEYELDESLAGQRMIVLCTYSLSASRCVDLLEVARAHKLTIVRRNGEWEFLATPEFKPGAEVRGRSEALDDLSKPFQGHETLTSRERSVLSLIVKGLSSKEIARKLDIAPRTVEFHRANLLKKTGAKSTIDLMHIVLGK